MTPSTKKNLENIDVNTVSSFGDEWVRYDQTQLSARERTTIFDGYFSLFPWKALDQMSVGFDMGCGSGRWAIVVAPRVGTLYCIDPSTDALDVARKTLADHSNVKFIESSANSISLNPGSFDFGYSLGVLHHVPDTSSALLACVSLLKPGAPFLLYLYYRFDNRPLWYRLIWEFSEIIRFIISKLPRLVKSLLSDFLALSVYWPIARFSRLIEWCGLNPSALPLSYYRHLSFFTMRTDCRDRFGTPLERRFTRIEIEKMMTAAGLKNIVFSDKEPYWVAVGTRI
jgi:ubiquinone/menaquinone biosynthesis C-methylase UbiE